MSQRRRLFRVCFAATASLVLASACAVQGPKKTDLSSLATSAGRAEVLGAEAEHGSGGSSASTRSDANTGEAKSAGTSGTGTDGTGAPTSDGSQGAVPTDAGASVEAGDAFESGEHDPSATLGELAWVPTSTGGMAGTTLPSDATQQPSPSEPRYLQGGAGGSTGTETIGMGGSIAAGSGGADGSSGGMVSGVEQTCGSVRDEVEADLPLGVRDGGGIVEIRRIVGSPTNQTATITTERTEVGPGNSVFTVSTGGADFLALLFRDSEGQLIDGQIHHPQCSGTRPVRTERVLEVPSEYSTIEKAMAAASEGDTVRVAAGTYSGAVTLKPGVQLLGAGPDQTTLDGLGDARNLIDASGAYGSVVMGFRFVNVTNTDSCASPDDEFACAGTHYRAAISADGHALDPDFCCYPSTTLIAGNSFESNDYAVMLYHRVQALVLGNTFEGNAKALVANHGADEIVFVEGNEFIDNVDVDLASSASRVFAGSNAFARSLACRTEHVQRGAFACNTFVDSQLCDLVSIGDNGNVDCSDGCSEPEPDCAPGYLGL